MNGLLALSIFSERINIFKVPTMFKKEMDDLKFIKFINIKFPPMLEKKMNES